MKLLFKRTLLVFIILCMFVSSISANGLEDLTSYFFDKYPADDFNFILIKAAFDIFLNNDNPDVNGLKTKIREYISEDDKRQIESVFGSLDNALSQMDVINQMSKTELNKFLNAFNNRDQATILNLINKYAKINESNSSSNLILLPFTPNNQNIDKVLNQIKENIIQNKDKFIIFAEKEEGKDSVLFSKDSIEKILESKKDVIIENKNIVMEIKNSIFNSNNDIEVIIKEIDIEDKVTKPVNTKYKNYRLNKVYNFELNNILESGKDKLTFDEDIKIKFDITDLKDVDKEKLCVYYFNEEKEEWEYVGGKLDESGNYIVFNASHFSKYGVMEFNRTFKDIENHWAKDTVEFIASKHILYGVDDERFLPDKTITRGEFIAIITRLLGLNYEDNDILFTDVNKDDWYYVSVMSAFKEGIINSNSDNYFGVKENITREEMAEVIYNALDYKNKIDISKLNVGFIIDSYNDLDGLDNILSNKISYIISKSIMIGRKQGYFNPDENATRAEASVVIRKILSEFK